LGQVVSQSELISRRGQWKGAGKGVVCASGGFDLLHPGHIRLLEHAKSLGDILVVAIESDAAIRARSASRNGSPGNNLARPITPATERAEILAALAAVDYVVEFEGISSREFFARLLPDVVAIGGGTGLDPAANREAADLEALGCKIARIPLEPGLSTTRLIERILEPRA
jgi:D-glycero-beta-D-manno-heptose 1-phosphate adenylyltransferase